MTFSQVGAMIWVSRSINFFALFSSAILLASCLSDESSKVDIRSIVGSWSGETDNLSWCIDMSEDQMYRHVQFLKREKQLKFQSGRFELQRGKRIFAILTVWGEEGYRNWSVDDEARVKHRDLYVVTDVSEKRMVGNALRANPGFTVGAESISERVDSCEPKIKELKTMTGAVSSV